MRLKISSTRFQNSSFLLIKIEFIRTTCVLAAIISCLDSQICNSILLKFALRLIGAYVSLFQYGPIVDIDLKIPPRPPGYAFVEVYVIYHS